MSFSHVHLSFFTSFSLEDALFLLCPWFSLCGFFTRLRVLMRYPRTRDLTVIFFLLLLVVLWIFTVTLCCSSVRGEVSDVWVEGQPRPDEAAALSCVRKSSGGRGGKSPLVTRQVATQGIRTSRW